MSRTASDPERTAALARLAALPDDRIDTADIPEAPEANWDQARRGLYRPLKTPVSLRLDADVVSWFKAQAQGGGYQTEINRILRRHMAAQEGRKGDATR